MARAPAERISPPSRNGVHRGVMLELLEGLEREEARIAVVEPGDEADVGAVVVEVIDEAAAVGARVQRPAHGVLHQPGLARVRAAAATAPSCRAHTPADRSLRVELVTLDEHLGEAAAAALGDHREARAHLRARRVVRAAASRRAARPCRRSARRPPSRRRRTTAMRRRKPANTSMPSASACVASHATRPPSEMMKLPSLCRYLRDPRHAARPWRLSQQELVARHGHADAAAARCATRAATHRAVRVRAPRRTESARRRWSLSRARTP